MFTTHEKYRQILESLPDGIYILDRDLIVHYMNPAIIAMLKRFDLNVELLGRKFTAVLPGAMGYLQGEVAIVYDTGKPMKVEHTVDLGKHQVTYETVRIPMVDASGKVQAVLNTIHDITNYLKIQKDLQESRHLFEIMVDNANSAILCMDLEGNVTYFNRFAENFFGFSRQEIIGRSVQETIVPPSDSHGRDLRDLISKITTHPEQYALNENENIKKDGTRVWLSWSNKPIFDEQGRCKELLSVGNDITALKNTQRELIDYRNRLEEIVKVRTSQLQESENRYRFLFEESPTLSVVIAPDGTITDINKAMAGSLGYTSEEMIGRNSFEFFDREQKNEAIAHHQRRLDGESLTHVENRVRAKDGSIRINLTTGHREIRDNDKVVGTLLCGLDITEQKKIEEERARRQEELIQTDRLTSLGTLVSGVAHEINNPNNFIILNADNLVDIWKEMRPLLDAHAANSPDLTIVGLPYNVLRSEMDHLLSGIREGASRIRNIVNHLKDFARQGPIDMNREISLRAVIDAAGVIVANAIKKCTGNFTVTIDPDVPNIRGDFQKIEQVVINLLTNACQALTSRDQAVAVTVKNCEDGKNICLKVSDQGMGIHPDVLSRIFDPFFTTKRDSGGTGLGLSISYGIVKDHRGTMEVRSEVGKGSDFIITLPAFSSTTEFYD